MVCGLTTRYGLLTLTNTLNGILFNPFKMLGGKIACATMASLSSNAVTIASNGRAGGFPATRILR